MILECRNLNKSFVNKKAVIDFNIKLQKGKIYGLLGENGSGKTTWMKIIAGLSKPTSGDIIFKGHTYYRIAGKDLINPPKTEGSERAVYVPQFLIDEIQEYIRHLYKPDPGQRLFDKRPQYVRSILMDRAKKAGVKQIRVHDLRHSHASMLINLGANPLLVAQRLGHESPEITLKTYSHLFPTVQTGIVNKIEKL